MSGVTVHSEEARRLIDRMARGVAGDGLLAGVYEAGLLYVRDLVDEDFRDGGRRHGGWKPPSPLTRILRTAGTTRVTGMSDAGDIPAQPLRDTRMLQMSMTSKGAEGALWEVTGRSALLGSSLARAEFMNEGGSKPFRFTTELQRNFDRHVRRKVGGKWNREYFVLRNWLKKVEREGRSFEVAARPIAPDEGYPMTQAEMERLRVTMDRELQTTIDRLDRPGGA